VGYDHLYGFGFGTIGTNPAGLNKKKRKGMNAQESIQPNDIVEYTRRSDPRASPRGVVLWTGLREREGCVPVDGDMPVAGIRLDPEWASVVGHPVVLPLHRLKKVGRVEGGMSLATERELMHRKGFMLRESGSVGPIYSRGIMAGEFSVHVEIQRKDERWVTSKYPLEWELQFWTKTVSGRQHRGLVGGCQFANPVAAATWALREIKLKNPVLDALQLWARPLPGNTHLLMCTFCHNMLPWGRRILDYTKCEDCGFDGTNGGVLLRGVWAAYSWTTDWRKTYADTEK
jgi:hypothetical protein